jgi:hypothetical protein
MSAARSLAASLLDPLTKRYENPAVIRATAANPSVRYRRTPNGRRVRVAAVGCPIAVVPLTMRRV